MRTPAHRLLALSSTAFLLSSSLSWMACSSSTDSSSTTTPGQDSGSPADSGAQSSNDSSAPNDSAAPDAGDDADLGDAGSDADQGEAAAAGTSTADWISCLIDGGTCEPQCTGSGSAGPTNCAELSGRYYLQVAAQCNGATEGVAVSLNGAKPTASASYGAASGLLDYTAGKEVFIFTRNSQYSGHDVGVQVDVNGSEIEATFVNIPTTPSNAADPPVTVSGHVTCH